ncbi:Os09g0398200 [Oryza sativa Japonica Group]|uniref:Os09g0398200 protein n=3 Tax=Oryza sativa TaxID=4530 RepID=B9G3F8_ORYSJ|nr:hypothetical protein OsI_31282 [Oryza sativa Indica Group]EEE69655.1 hypothetical protein OsJ_29269 [Oryza sativa Japonica Group]KAB8110400.1 hypothetical protein EE612_047618 [Oryza sativa]BAT07947.1 Os09g0398200 [Oryza sativa Japonica Group]
MSFWSTEGNSGRTGRRILLEMQKFQNMKSGRRSSFVKDCHLLSKSCPVAYTRRSL